MDLGTYATALEAAVVYAKHMAEKGIYPPAPAAPLVADGPAPFTGDDGDTDLDEVEEEAAAADDEGEEALRMRRRRGRRCIEQGRVGR